MIAVRSMSSSLKTIFRQIPENTAMDQLLHLHASYDTLESMIPDWYRRAMLTRIQSLLKSRQDAE